MEIKRAPSHFITKINYILDLYGKPKLQKGRIKAICDLTKEPETTVNNWMFNGKIPRESKRLLVADYLGVSYCYLFDDEIPADEPSKPELHFNNNLYSIPLIYSDKIYDFSTASLFQVTERVELSFPVLAYATNKFGNSVYITQLKNNDLLGASINNTNVIYSERALIEDGTIVLVVNKVSNSVTLRIATLADGNIKLTKTTNNTDLIEFPAKTDSIYPVITTYW